MERLLALFFCRAAFYLRFEIFFNFKASKCACIELFAFRRAAVRVFDYRRSTRDLVLNRKMRPVAAFLGFFSK